MVDFCAYVYPEWVTKPHHELIGEKLDAVSAGDIRFLDISMPPRHGKSQMGSVFFPALWLAKNPDKQIIHASYASGLSNKFSLEIRALIRDDAKYKRLFPHMALHPDRARVDDWKTVWGGGFKSVGVGGGITGHGADLFIIDDPLKEGDEQSVTVMESIYTWYTSAARTRLHPGAPVVIIATRWSPLDLIGRLHDAAKKDPDADQWESLVLAALAEDNDPLGRDVGEPLWPERVSKPDLIAVQRLSERYFAALYQQRPTISEVPMFVEGDFVRFDPQRYKPAAGDSKPTWTIDLAMTDDERSDYNVFARWVKRGDSLRLYQLHRFRAEWPEAKAKLLELMDEYPDDDYALPKQLLELLAVQTVRAERPKMMGQMHEVSMPKDKVSRAQVHADLVRRKGLLVCEGETGDYFVEEHVGFPDVAQHDDCIDVASVATHHFGFVSAVDIMTANEDDQVRRDVIAETIERLS